LLHIMSLVQLARTTEQADSSRRLMATG
jgi:hypothetical protein